MRLNKKMKVQLALFTVIALIAVLVMTLHFMRLPAMLFGVGRYYVTVELPQASGLYGGGNVTYRGTEIGRVDAVRLTPTGVEAVLALKSGIDVPSDLRAEVHSQSAIGEQYVDLLPRNGDAPALRDGDVIARANTSVPPDVNTVLTDVNAGLQAIPQDNLKTVIDESYTAVGGLGPELSRIVTGTSDLAIKARANLDPIIALIDKSQPVLDSQTNSSDAIAAWAKNLSTVTDELKTHDRAVAGVIDNTGATAEEVRQLVERIRPTLPVLLANLTSVGSVAVSYRADLEQILVLLPQLVSINQAGVVTSFDTKEDYKGQRFGFNLNVNLPPGCATGFLPAQQRRSASDVDAPPRTGDLYCRVPQDSPFNVRGARNIPCETVPGKRAPTAAMCESDEQYVPLNDGMNWKGDPNATLSGQPIPQLPPGAAAPPSATPPVAIAQYDPATGEYVGPDGKRYKQSDLAQTSNGDRTWQTMLLPPPS
ncbi:MAG TPA: MlaD family protein [Propionibacteriaceae bacterium]|nr:MlaD family protein [Propionibacteriaceae bacterium]